MDDTGLTEESAATMSMYENHQNRKFVEICVSKGSIIVRSSLPPSAFVCLSLSANKFLAPSRCSLHDLLLSPKKISNRVSINTVARVVSLVRCVEFCNFFTRLLTLFESRPRTNVCVLDLLLSEGSGDRMFWIAGGSSSSTGILPVLSSSLLLASRSSIWHVIWLLWLALNASSMLRSVSDSIAICEMSILNGFLKKRDSFVGVSRFAVSRT